MLFCYLNMNHLFINRISCMGLLDWWIGKPSVVCGLWFCIFLHLKKLTQYFCFPLELCFVSQGLSNPNRCYLYISDPNTVLYWVHKTKYVFRYIMSEQKKAEEFGITEDDVSEIRQVLTTCWLLIGCFWAILWLLIGQEIQLPALFWTHRISTSSVLS